MLTLRCLPLLQGGSNGGLLMGAVLNQVSHLLPAEKLSCQDGLCVFSQVYAFPAANGTFSLFHCSKFSPVIKHSLKRPVSMCSTPA